MNRIVHSRFASFVHTHSLRTLLLLVTLLVGTGAALAQTTAFTYQGRLTDGGNPANGPYDLQVRLFDALTGGNQIGATNSINGVAVTGGVFTTTLDFGAAAFPGANRWAEISARPAGNANFTTLTPRQPVTSTPYAIKSLSAGAADSLSVSCNGCVTGSQIGSLPASSGNYIQNTSTQQASSNFNISGSGTVGVKLGIGSPVNNSLYKLDVTNANGSFFRAFDFAPLAGTRLMADFNGGSGNGGQARFSGVGTDFMDIGQNATGDFVVESNDTPQFAVLKNGNVGIGTTAPTTKLQVNGDVRGGTFAGTFVTADQTIVVDRTGLNDGTANFGLFPGLVFGGFPLASGEGIASKRTNGGNAFGLDFFTSYKSRLSIANNGNVGIGAPTPADRLEIGGFSDPGDNYLTIKTAGGNQRRGGIKFRVFANDLGFTIENDERGVSNGLNILRHTFNEQAQVPVTFSALFIDKQNGNVGINTVTPADRLQVVGDLRVGTGTTGCVRDADGTVIAGTCSSDLRFKKDVTPFANVLDKVARLQPVYFNWRASEFPNKHFGNTLSFGLIAQDVEQVLPELVTKDELGFRAVNYSKLPLLTIQAVKELKAENEALKQQNAALETRLEALEQMMQPLTGQQTKQPKQQ